MLAATTRLRVHLLGIDEHELPILGLLPSLPSPKYRRILREHNVGALGYVEARDEPAADIPFVRGPCGCDPLHARRCLMH